MPREKEKTIRNYNGREKCTGEERDEIESRKTLSKIA